VAEEQVVEEVSIWFEIEDSISDTSGYQLEASIINFIKSQPRLSKPRLLISKFYPGSQPRRFVLRFTMTTPVKSYAKTGPKLINRVLKFIRTQSYVKAAKLQDRLQCATYFPGYL